MTDEATPTQPQVLVKFSAFKVLGTCGVMTAVAVFTWTLFPALNDYQGNRFSPETATFLLVSSSAILTAFLPLWVWHIWNFVTCPGALYISGGRLFIYWTYFQSVPIKDITAALDLGRSGPLGDIVRLSVIGRRDVKFQTTFIARSGSEVVASIKQVASITT